MFHLLCNLIDARDARRAERLRGRLGTRRWLISWERRGRRHWVARLSGPEWPVTIARCGRSRCQAARRADQALSSLIADDVCGAVAAERRSNSTLDL